MIGHNYVQLDYASDSGEDDDWWNDRNYTQSGVKVEVCTKQYRIHFKDKLELILTITYI